ncbi:hypothetical protein LPJ53_006582, partial [Coemansia erecta]
SAVEIATTPDGKSAKVVKTSFEENGREKGKEETQMSPESVVSVLALVEDLQKVPMQSAPGIPDVFGKNTVVLVRKGKQVLWAYNPGAGGCCSGCGAHGEDEQQQVAPSVADDHKEQFANIVDSLSKAADSSFSSK